MALIEPRTLKGFRDYLPEAMIPRERLIATAQRVYRSFGFSPIDTPALEYLEVLTGKGSEETDRQLYQFTDHGGRQVGMRFDLTVPLARFAAQHIHELGTPFKRYHIASVWRGENTQRGRYREFMQCDFDTIGTKSVMADIETALVIHELMRAIGIERFTIHLNNRMVLNGLLERLGLLDKSVPILRAIDKLAKIGPAKVAEEMMATAGTSMEQAESLLKLADLKGSNDEILRQLAPLVAGNERGEAGVARLAEIVQGAAAGGVPAARLQLDVGIARGLDYYTGAIFETFSRSRNCRESVLHWGSIDCSRRSKSCSSLKKCVRRRTC
jgi:histidyl-tRNA synthetase